MLDFQKKALHISLLVLLVTCAVAMGEKSSRQSSTRRPNANNSRLTSTRRGSAPPPSTTWYPPPNTTWYPPPNTTNETSSESTENYRDSTANYYYEETTMESTTEAKSIQPTTTTATTTEIPSTTTATTTTTTPVVTTQKPSIEMNPEEIMKAANATIEKAELGLYKEKTRMTIGLMKEVLPRIQDLQKDMVALMKSSDGPSPVSFSTFKENDEVLQRKMTNLEAKFDLNRDALEKYNLEYKKMEVQLQNTHEALRNMLMAANGTSLGHANDPTRVLQTCGGNLSSRSGSIMYKDRQNLESVENCIWTISTDATVAAATQLTVTLSKTGFTQCYETYLAVGYFANSEYSNHISWAKFDAPTSQRPTMTIPAPVAFIHFVAGQCRNSMSSNSKGFQLDFEFTSRNVQAIQASSSGPPMDYKYTNIFLTEGSGTLRYPQNGLATYAAQERVSIVIQPTVPNATFRLNWYRTEGNYDRINVFSYQSSSVSWTQNGPFSGERLFPTELRFEGLCPMIVTFQSDSSNNFPGFEMSY